MGKNKAFCSPGTQNGRRVIKVYSTDLANHLRASQSACAKNTNFLVWYILIKNWFMLSVRISGVTHAREKFGEHERSVKVARGATESNSSFLSALQLPKCIHNSIYAQLKA